MDYLNVHLQEISLSVSKREKCVRICKTFLLVPKIEIYMREIVKLCLIVRENMDFDAE